jgi:ABC-type antimicrobial peptide transport system ATPase subunit
LGSKIEDAQAEIKTMNESIKNIENMLSKLSAEGISGLQSSSGGGESKKGFFGSLFTKN